MNLQKICDDAWTDSTEVLERLVEKYDNNADQCEMAMAAMSTAMIVITYGFSGTVAQKRDPMGVFEALVRDALENIRKMHGDDIEIHVSKKDGEKEVTNGHEG